MNPGIYPPTSQLAAMPRGLLAEPRPVPMPDNYWHPEAIDWATRVAANGGVIFTKTIRAMSEFCYAIDTAGIRDRFARLNLFCGVNLSSALVPLYRSFSFGGMLIGNATDTNVNFVNADFTGTGAVSGLKGNGINKFLNTGLPANAIKTNNMHLGIGLVQENTLAFNRSAIGAFSGSNIVGITCSGSGRLAGLFGSFGNIAQQCGPSTNTQLNRGNLVASFPFFYRDAVREGASASSFAQYNLSNPIFVFALSTSTSGVTDLVNARLNYYSIGATMTPAQVASYDAAIAILLAALDRA